MKILSLILILFLSFEALAQKSCSFGIENSKMRDYRYIIVPGILNELLAYYMTEHRRFLMDKGVPADQIHRINLSSLAVPDDAVEVLRNKIQKFPQDKAFVFISHSKGALETLYYLMEHHQKINLKNALLIQGPLDGASITRLPDEEDFLGFFNFVVKKFTSTSFVRSYDKSYSYKHIRTKLTGLSDYPNLLKKIIFIESGTEYSKLKWKFKPLGSQYKEFFGRVGDGVLLDSDHVPFVLKGSDQICRLVYNLDHSDLVKAAPWNSLRINKIRDFLEDVFY